MKSRIRAILISLGALAMMSPWQNCAKGFKVAKDDQASSSIPGSQLTGTGTYKVIRSEILNAKCMACHDATTKSGGIDLTSYASLVLTGSVVSGNHNASSLYTAVFSGAMPQGGPALSLDDVYWIRTWIDSGALENELPTVTVAADVSVTFSAPSVSANLSGTGTDRDGTVESYLWSQVSGPSVATFGTASMMQTTVNNLKMGTYVFRLTATDDSGGSGSNDMTVNVVTGVSLATLNANIFSPKCSACHSGAAPLGGFDITTYAGILKAVVVGDAAGSKLFQNVDANLMPAGGPPLSQIEKDQIRDWINQGALFN